MTFRDWQQLSPQDAAREIARGVSRLSAAQQRAVIAQLPDETALQAAFSSAVRQGPLGGVPYFLKDLFPVAGQPMFAGSTFLPHVLPPAKSDAAIVQALRKTGAVLSGRTHLHEFAYGITGENPHYGDCTHPRFPDRTTGGSSSGSAALVAAGVVPLAIGTDTGGSVRVPAAFCGLFGFRLTPRDALVADAFPLAPSYDTAGWFTANAGDMRAAIDALVGLQSAATTPRGCYVALPNLDADVAHACTRAAAQFTSPADAATRDTLLNAFAPALETYGNVVAEEAWTVHQGWADRFQKDYDPAVWPRLTRGRSLTAAQRDAARRTTESIHAAWREYFKAHDFLLLPATPCAALTKPDCNVTNRGRLLSVTSPVSIGGLPVLTVPVPLPSGLTTGLQVVVNDPRSPAVAWVLDQLSRG